MYWPAGDHKLDCYELTQTKMYGMAVVQGTVLFEGEDVSPTQQELELHPSSDLLLAPETQLRKVD